MLDRFKSALKRKLDAVLYDEPHAEPTAHVDKKQLMHMILAEDYHATEHADVIAKGQPDKIENNPIPSNYGMGQVSDVFWGLKNACNSSKPSNSKGLGSSGSTDQRPTRLPSMTPNESASNLSTLSNPLSPQKPQSGPRTLFPREVAAAYQIHWRYHTNFPVPPVAEIMNWIITNWERHKNEWEELLRSNETPSQTLERHRSVELDYSTPKKVAAAEHLRRARKEIKALVLKRKKAKIQAKRTQNKVLEDMKLEDMKLEESRKRCNLDVHTPSHEEPANVDREVDLGRKEQESEQDDVPGELPSESLPIGLVAEYVHPPPREDILRGLPQFKRLERHMVWNESHLRFQISVKDDDVAGA